MTDITMGRFTTKYKISDFAESGYAILLGSHQAAIVLQVVDDFKKRPRRLEDGPEVAVRRGLFLEQGELGERGVLFTIDYIRQYMLR